MKNIRKFMYGNKEAEEMIASGVSGDLCKGADREYFFRVYHQDKSFTDYELNHDDLSIIISRDALASFYKIKDHNILDHSPEVLALKEL